MTGHGVRLLLVEDDAKLVRILRRGARGPRHSPDREPTEVGDLRLGAAAHAVTRGGDRIELTGREFAVLEVLARNAGRVVPRRELIERVWDDDPGVSAN